MCGCLLSTSYWVPGLHLSHVPWPGIEQVTLWFTIYWATPARAYNALVSILSSPLAQTYNTKHYLGHRLVTMGHPEIKASSCGWKWLRCVTDSRTQAPMIQPPLSPNNTQPWDHVTAYYLSARTRAVQGGRGEIQNSPLCSMLTNFAKRCDEEWGKVFEVLAFIYFVCCLLP